MAFCRTRKLVELVLKYTLQLLRPWPSVAARVTSYRGGYTKADRRMIEKRLFAGELLGVACTCALELGECSATFFVCWALIAASRFDVTGTHQSFKDIACASSSRRGGHWITGRYRSARSSRSNVDAVATSWPGLCVWLLCVG